MQQGAERHVQRAERSAHAWRACARGACLVIVFDKRDRGHHVAQAVPQVELFLAVKRSAVEEELDGDARATARGMRKLHNALTPPAPRGRTEELKEAHE
jgi:hypothetical protein